MTATKLTKDKVSWLFDYVWPRMPYSASHRDTCIRLLDRINDTFDRFKDNPDKLLVELRRLDGVGLTIASGLMFASNPQVFVPFDKYTMGWSLHLRIIPDNFISTGNYADYSQRVVSHIQNCEHLETILNFVREADEKLDEELAFHPE